MRRLLALASLVCLTAGPAWAAYPERTVRLVVAIAPGGTPDILARLLAAQLSQRTGQQFVVENRMGAGGNIAAEAVAKAPPDGYTLFLPASAILTLNPAVYSRLRFDPVKDFAPISILGSGGYYFLACPSMPFSSIRELVAAAKTRTLTYGTSGYGTSHHLAGEMLNRMAGIRLEHVPYKGFGQGLQDALGCKVDVIVGAVAGSQPYLKNGRMKALAITSTRRFSGTPDVPTMAEAGFPGYEVEGWYSLLATAGTPRAVIDRLHAQTVAIVKDPEFAEKLREQGLDPVGNTPEEFAARLRAELASSAKLVKSLGLSVE